MEILKEAIDFILIVFKKYLTPWYKLQQRVFEPRSQRSPYL